jgi:hypothetical protein
MHNLDRTQRMFEPQSEEYGALESDEYSGETFDEEFITETDEEYLAEAGEGAYEAGEVDESGESVFNEMDEMDLASELLGVSDEDELDLFLGKLVKKASRAARGFLKSTAGKALIGTLKGVARKALPIAGSALGGMIGGPIGAKLGSMAAGHAGKIFGLEVEGLSEEDASFEVARRFVRFAGSAARNTATTAASSASPQQAVQASVASAARRFAPGLMRRRPAYGAPAGGGSASPATGFGRSGQWIRRGRRIILLGV